MKNNTNKHFLCTSDAETAKALREDGLLEIGMQNGRWIFVNDFSKQEFSNKVDEKDVFFTNRMTM